jgi:subtilisin-like proprotein convertase family protein
LNVFLISPTGIRIELFSAVGGSGENFGDNLGMTLLDDQASTRIASGSAPFIGSYKPAGLLSAVNGLSANGVWTLEVTDTALDFTGTVNTWTLDINTDVFAPTFSTFGMPATVDSQLGDVVINNAYTLTLSGNAAADSEVENAMSLTDTLDNLIEGDATAGSAVIFAPIVLSSSSNLSFNWSFTGSDQYTDWRDFAFVEIDGAAQDTFRFVNALANNVDTITDFTPSDDSIELSHLVFNKLAKIGELNANNLAIGSAADNNDYIIYNPNTGVVSYDADGLANKIVAVIIAILGSQLH